ncbi:MAG: aminotransferase class I/II-fold pyridoxal phosphate-dependent enzyme [Firmicutes bacterium]|nr:aminotransferase class I/II-fold pyridoxal phosphate-dependent enzyme [Bacillota bacterium]
MKYDFTSIIDRTGTNQIAVDMIPIPNAVIQDGFSKIPMWVADMNFPTVPTIQEEIIKRVQHPTFGYYEISDEYYDSIIDWQAKRNNVTNLSKKNISYQNGVLGGVVSVANVLCSKGDKILLHSPTYIGFTGALENNGYKLIHSPLLKDENGVWRMDYEDMDKKLKEHKIHCAIFCSPFNPCGRVWEKWEIEKAMEIYEKNDCFVISDEIWSDIILNGNVHTPTQSVSDWARNHVAAMYAPSKTFNLAGLQGSYSIIYNSWLQDRMLKEASLSHYNACNVLAMHALIGAYKPEGHEWVEELREVLSDNVNYAYDFIQENFEGVEVSKPEGTYMLYLDCTKWCEKNNLSIDELQRKGVSVGVVWQDGRPFHHPCSIRMNLAVPHSLVIEAFDRLKKYVF